MSYIFPLQTHEILDRYELLGGKTDSGLDRYSQEAMPRMVVHNTHLLKDVHDLPSKKVWTSFGLSIPIDIL